MSIPSVGQKLNMLRRRRDFLAERIRHHYGDPNYDKAECAALTWAIQFIEEHYQLERRFPLELVPEIIAPVREDAALPPPVITRRPKPAPKPEPKPEPPPPPPPEKPEPPPDPGKARNGYTPEKGLQRGQARLGVRPFAVGPIRPPVKVA
jgi:hypothetical protein